MCLFVLGRSVGLTVCWLVRFFLLFFLSVCVRLFARLLPNGLLDCLFDRLLVAGSFILCCAFVCVHGLCMRFDCAFVRVLVCLCVCVCLLVLLFVLFASSQGACVCALA